MAYTADALNDMVELAEKIEGMTINGADSYAEDSMPSSPSKGAAAALPILNYAQEEKDFLKSLQM